MTRVFLRRIASVGAMLGLAVATSPRIEAAPTAPVATASVNANQVTLPAATATQRASETGRGWGAMLACAGCAVAAGLIAAGGPGSILIAVNTPGSALALMTCVAVCNEAVQ
jgi:hypothetical protein